MFAASTARNKPKTPTHRPKDNGITIKVFGERVMINGNKQIIDEMIYNLCENAIKYNKPNTI